MPSVVRVRGCSSTPRRRKYSLRQRGVFMSTVLPPNISDNSNSMPVRRIRPGDLPSSNSTSTSTSLSGPEIITQHGTEKRELPNVVATAEVGNSILRDVDVRLPNDDSVSSTKRRFVIASILP